MSGRGPRPVTVFLPDADGSIGAGAEEFGDEVRGCGKPDCYDVACCSLAERCGCLIVAGGRLSDAVCTLAVLHSKTALVEPDRLSKGWQ